MDSRRDFLRVLVATTAAGGWSVPGSARGLEPRSGEPQSRSEGIVKPILPKGLEKGMTVALISPSSPLFDPDRYRQAEDVVRSLGLVPKLGAHATARYGYLAGRDEERLSDLESAFADESVDAIWCLRGGYGALRLLPRFRFDLVRANPKILLGYSDITALHLAIAAKVGLVGFHGPMLNTDLSEYSQAELWKVLGKGAKATVIGTPPVPNPKPGQTERSHRVLTIRGGKARGRLFGGNLSLVTRLVGTPYLPDLAGALLFLEDVGESGYRIDGMLCQLRLAGVLQKVAGIIFGKFTEDVPKTADQGRLPTETVLRELTSDLEVPVIAGWMCGHVADQTTVPCGISAEFDADRQTVSLLEAAVR
jgi:muramoyltetrapeptide carboxypeptidase